MSDQQAITEMFDDISPRYDFLNHLLSFNIDKIWRRKASRLVAKCQPTAILDVATGTADLAIRMATDIPSASIIGVDLSEKMLAIGRQKIAKKKYDAHINLLTANAIDLPFEDNCFDAVTVAFGVRNFKNLEAGLREMLRVTKNNGFIIILEFSRPRHGIIRGPYRFYLKHALPWIGRTISTHQTAYSYLPTSIEAFPKSNSFMKMLQDLGIQDIRCKALCGGISTLYFGHIRLRW